MSKGKFYEFDEILCSFRLKKIIQTMTIATFLCVRRAHTTNEWLHRITQEKD